MNEPKAGDKYEFEFEYSGGTFPLLLEVQKATKTHISYTIPGLSGARTVTRAEWDDMNARLVQPA